MSVDDGRTTGLGYDLVALDVDGTLLDGRKRLSRQTIGAVRAVARAGGHVVLASARPPRSLTPLCRQLGLETLQINYNGAAVWDTARGCCALHRPLCGQLVRQIVHQARQVAPELAVSVEILDRWYTDRVQQQYMIETARDQQPHYLGPLEPVYERDLTKLLLLGEPGELAAVREQVSRRFEGQVGLMISDAHLLQVVHAEVDKGRALQWVAGHYGVGRERVLAIGDAPNDAAMLRWAGLGLAVADGWPEALAAADAVVPGHDEDGVARALRRYVLEAAGAGAGGGEADRAGAGDYT